MTTTLDDLRAAILADLDSDEPRLVYADALQAAGDPSGELIAIQCELARLGCDRTRVAMWGVPPPGVLPSNHRRDWIGDALADTSDPKRLATLRAREKKLIPELGAVGIQHFPRGGARFGRGFVDHVYSGTNPDVLEHAPFARSLELGLLSAPPNTMNARSLDRLRQLRVWCHYDNLAVVDCLGSLPNLRELGLEGLYAGMLDAFEASPAIARLEALDLYRSVLDSPERLERLLSTARLRDLRVGMNGVGGEGGIAEVFERCARVASLEILDLLSSSLDTVKGALARLVRSPHLQHLRALRVSDPERPACFADEGARAIGESFPELRVLDLAANPFAPYLSDLVAGRGLAQLTHLDLSSCKLDDTAATALASSALFGRLRVLALRGNQITDAGAAALAGADATKLEMLDLGANKLTAKGRALLKAKFPQARVLAGKK